VCAFAKAAGTSLFSARLTSNYELQASCRADGVPGFLADNFDAAVVVFGGEASPNWKTTEFVSFLRSFFKIGKPVAFVTLPGQSPALPDWFRPAWRVEYRESDNLSFLQLVWTIVGYQPYDLGDKKPAPRAFISYSWDSEAHKAWIAELAARLRSDGVDVILDQWHVRLGDQLPQFMETSVRDSDFVLIICTPRYKERSNQRSGGVGYEGHVITAEVFYSQNQRKFIPVLRLGEWDQAAPSWLLGRIFADLRGEPYSESTYQNLKNTIRRMLPEAPPIGRGTAGS
jgi:TIR domain